MTGVFPDSYGGDTEFQHITVDECGEVVVARETPVCPKCGCKHFTQDEDTLDTWFSSALWPSQHSDGQRRQKN